MPSLFRHNPPIVSDSKQKLNDDNGDTCDTCRACCCKLEVMLMGDDDIPRRFTRQDAWGGWVMHRLDDGWCAALDRDTFLCTIYGRRPFICREFAAGDSDCLAERAAGLPQALAPREPSR